MYKTKLIRHLKHFSKEEMARFGHYLESPFFFKGKKAKKLIKFHHLLNRYHPAFEEQKLCKKGVFAELFPGREYNEQALQQLMTKFNKALKCYIRVTFRDSSFGYPPEDMAMTNFYQQKKMLPNFEQLHEEMTNKWANKSPQTPAHFWIDFLLAKQLSDHQGQFNLRHTDLNLPQTLSSLDYFYVAMKLEFACEFLNQKKHNLPLKVNDELASLEALLPLIKAGQFRETPLIDLLYRTYILLQEDSSEADYRELKKHYEMEAMNIDLTQRRMVHGALRNYCTSQINAGHKDFLEELLMLYQEGLPQNVLYSDGGLVSSTFQNMVTVGIKLERYEWVKDFLEEHRNRIISMEEPESIYALNKARLLFVQQDYEEALDYLTFNFTDTYFKLIARRLEIQIYYELKSTILESKIQAFKVFVFRTSKSLLTQIQQEGYSNFIDLLKQIIHPSTRYNPKRIAGLISKLDAKNTVAEKKWLQQKLLEME